MMLSSDTSRRLYNLFGNANVTFASVEFPVVPVGGVVKRLEFGYNIVSSKDTDRVSVWDGGEVVRKDEEVINILSRPNSDSS